MLEGLLKRFPDESLRRFEDGEVIFEEGSDEREMYIVRSGAVILERKINQGKAKISTITKGGIFGEMALLESLPRTATAIAQGKTEVVVFQPGGFLLKIRRDPTLAFEMLQLLSRRIRNTNEKLIQAIESLGASKDQVRSILEDQEYSQ